MWPELFQVVTQIQSAELGNTPRELMVLQIVEVVETERVCRGLSR